MLTEAMLGDFKKILGQVALRLSFAVKSHILLQMLSECSRLVPSLDAKQAS